MISRKVRYQAYGVAFQAICLVANITAVVFLFSLLADIFITGSPHLSLDFLTQYQSNRAERSGMLAAVTGSAYVLLITAIAGIPMGVGAAIYLEEYSRDTPFIRFIKLNIQNLASVPSIIYGILGLTLFVSGFSHGFTVMAGFGAITTVASLVLPGLVYFLMGIALLIQFVSDRRFLLAGGALLALVGVLGFYALVSYRLATSEMAMGRGVLAGALTMALLILPVVVIATQEAIRAVPDSFRHAGFGIGMTRWQVVRHMLMPVAVPGILTGIILALGRAVGETAPLIVVGALTYVTFSPVSPFDRFTVMPIQIFNWTRYPQKEFHDLAATGIIIVIAFLLLMNGLAIYLRAYYRSKLKHIS